MKRSGFRRAALATYAPDDQRWGKIGAFVANHLVKLEASSMVAWRDELRPAKAKLITPLSAIYREKSQKEQSRIYATETLTDYAVDQPDELFELLADADTFQFAMVFEKLGRHKDRVVAHAQDELAKKLADNKTEDDKESLAKRQAHAAVALLRLGQPESVWPLLEARPDPRVRSYLVHWASPLEVDAQLIVKRFETEPVVSIRGALALTLGEFTETQLSIAQRQPLIDKLLRLYENDPDPGLHGAVEWLLRKWGQAKSLETIVERLKSDDKQRLARKSSDKRQWYVDTQGQTFVIVNARDFKMGSPETEPGHESFEVEHRQRIGRRFAVSSHQVTKAQYRLFQESVKGIDLANLLPQLHQVVRTDDSPQTGMTWYEAAHYCNWLTEQDHIPPDQKCYEPNENGEYGSGMRAKNRFWELSGYRLPTEAEWECACRAETVTSRYYGECEELLPQYAWYLANGHDRAWPIAHMKPNDLGLFDMLGNVWVWCFDEFAPYTDQGNNAVEDRPSTISLEDKGRRILRGGSFGNQALKVRPAQRTSENPGLRKQAQRFSCSQNLLRTINQPAT